MNADDRRGCVDIAEYQGDTTFHATRRRRIAGSAGLRLRDNTFKTMNAEMSPAGREVGLRYLADRDGGHA